MFLSQKAIDIALLYSDKGCRWQPLLLFDYYLLIFGKCYEHY